MEQTFTENEKISISIIILNLMTVDKKLHSKELASRFAYCTKYDIPLCIPTDCEITKPQAIEIVKAMSHEKKEIVRNILHELAMSDCEFDKSEGDFIRKLCV